MNLQDKEEKIYNQLIIFQNGDDEDKSFYFECIGYLGNEYINDPLEKRLNIIEKNIIQYLNEKEKQVVSSKKRWF